MEKSNSIKRMNIFLAIVVLLLAGACAFLVYSRMKDKDALKQSLLRQQILLDKNDNDRNMKDKAFYEKYRMDAARKAEIRKNELNALASGMYDTLLISNTDVCFRAEWVAGYFNQNALIPNEKLDTPEMIETYLEASLVEGGVRDIYFEIDPYELENNYYAEHKFDNSKKTYMQMFQQAVWNYAKDYPDVTFHMLIPVRSIKIWETYSLEDYGRRYSAWEQYIKYSSRYDNIIITNVATEEWLIVNEELFDENGYLLEEYERNMFATQIGYADYRIDYNNFEEMWNVLDAAVRNDSTQDYYRPDYSDTNYVFIGDSMFYRYELACKNVPEMFGALTKGNIYNLAIGGTTAVSSDSISFCEMINRLIKKDTSDLPVRVQNVIETFDSNSKDKLVFVILYGFNDYSNNYPLGAKGDVESDTYIGALNKGIEMLKKEYPECSIILCSPIYTGYNDGGKKSFVEGGNTLLQYIKAMQQCAKENKAMYIDMYNESGINEKNHQTMLTDSVHPYDHGNYLMAQTIIKHLITENKSDN